MDLKKIMINFFSLIAIIIGFFFFFQQKENFIDKLTISFMLIVNFTALFFFLTKKENFRPLKKQYLRPSYLFILGFCITYFQYYLDIIFEYTTSDFYIIDKKYLVKALALITIAFNFYMIGYNICLNSIASFINTKKPPFVNIKYLTIVAFLLLVIFYATVDINYLAGGYPEYSKGVVAGPLSFLFENLIIAILVLKSNMIRSNNTKSTGVLTTIIKFKYEILTIMIYLISFILSGERDIFVFLCLALITSIFYSSGAKFKLSYLIVGLIAGGTILSIIGIARMSGSSDSISSKVTSLNEGLSQGNTHESIFSPTAELAGSGRIVTLSVKYIDEGLPHTKGLFMLLDTLLIFPGLKTYFMNLFDIPSSMSSSADYLTFLYLGRNADYGIGTSSISDTYIDFGLIGVIVIFFLIGFLSRKFDIILNSDLAVKLIYLILTFLFISYSIFLSRSSLLYFLSRLFYVGIFVLFAYKFFRTNKS